MDPQHVEWIHGEIDGTNSRAESAALREVLLRDPGLRERYDGLTRCAKLLDRVESAEPPHGLGAAILAQGNQLFPDKSGIGKRNPTGGAREGAGMTKGRRQILWAAAGLAATVAIVGYLGGMLPSSPTGEEAAGTIGAAKRYRAEQISNTDVTLESADLQAFLQSAEFNALASNRDFARALSNPDFGRAMKNPDFAAALSNPDFARAMKNPDFATAVAKPELARALKNPDFAAALSNPDFARAMKNPDFAAALAKPDFARALKNPDFATALQGADLGRADGGSASPR